MNDSRKKRTRTLIAVAAMLSPAWLPGACTGSSDAPPSRTSYCTSTELTFSATGFCGFGEKAYAFGGSGILLFDGSEWRDAGVGVSPGTVGAIWCDSEADLYVGGVREDAGDYTSMLARWDGESWSEMEHPTNYNRIVSVWGAAQDDVFAIARNEGNGINTIIHYNGLAWIEQADLPGWPERLWGTSGTDVYVMGDDWDGFVYHYDGGSWTLFELPESPDGLDSFTLHDAWATSTDDVHFVGGSDWSGSSSGVYPAIARKTGTTWATTVIDLPYNGMIDVSPPNVWLGAIWGYGDDSIIITDSSDCWQDPHGDHGYYWDGAVWNEFWPGGGDDVWGISPQRTFIAGDPVREISCP